MSRLSATEIMSVKCPVCGAEPGNRCISTTGIRARRFHKDRELKASFATSAKTPAKPTKKKTPPKPECVNHIALMMDSSGSMQGLRFKAIQVINEQIDSIKRSAQKSGQRTIMSVYTFDRTLRLLVPPSDSSVIQHITQRDYDANGSSTSLRDAVGLVAQEYKNSFYSDKLNHSFLVITITDGEENSSTQYSVARVSSLMGELHATDRWTFVFSVPRGHSHYVQRFGALPGNIQEWDQTERGMEVLSRSVTTGYDNYYEARSKGNNSVRNFFSADLSKVNTKVLNQRLDDLSGDFYRWAVHKDMPIKDFVEESFSLTPHRLSFSKGRGYYQLTKSETVQETKDFLIMDSTTGAVYGGDQARTLAGIPQHQRVQVHPGNLKNYKLFILSTSANRKLKKGTLLLYKK